MVVRIKFTNLTQIGSNVRNQNLTGDDSDSTDSRWLIGIAAPAEPCGLELSYV